MTDITREAVELAGEFFEGLGYPSGKALLRALRDALDRAERERDALLLKLQLHAGDITSASNDADREHEARVHAERERDEALEALRDIRDDDPDGNTWAGRFARAILDKHGGNRD